MPFIKNQCMFVYADADLDSNQKMQEPLQKLYQYENQPDMREKIREYINELDTEINRCENELQKYYKSNGDIGVISMQNRIQILIEVKNDLLGRLEEVIQMKRLDIYKTNDGKSLVLLNNETDSNGYINYLPITNSANGMSVNTKSGNPVIIDIDNVSIIKMNKLESYIDHVIESDFDFKIKWYIDGRQREEVKD